MGNINQSFLCFRTWTSDSKQWERFHADMRQVTTWLLVAEADLERKGRAAYEVLLPHGRKLKLVLIKLWRLGGL